MSRMDTLGKLAEKGNIMFPSWFVIEAWSIGAQVKHRRPRDRMKHKDWALSTIGHNILVDADGEKVFELPQYPIWNPICDATWMNLSPAETERKLPRFAHCRAGTRGWNKTPHLLP